MKRFVECEDRRQGVLLPEYLDDFVADENQVRVIETFVDALDFTALGFDGAVRSWQAGDEEDLGIKGTELRCLTRRAQVTCSRD